MSNKVISWAGLVLMTSLAGFLAGAQPGCGSSGGSSDDPRKLCEQGCDKTVACFAADGGSPITAAQCKSLCASQGGNGTTCSNVNAITAKLHECLAMNDCAAVACLETVPDCQTGGGTGGSSGAGTGGSSGTGTGGSSGTGAGGSSGTGAGGSSGTGAGGSSGAAECAPCVKTDTCCLAVFGAADAGAASCNYASACNSLPAGANRTTYIQGCQAFLTTAAQTPNAPAACQ